MLRSSRIRWLALLLLAPAVAPAAPSVSLHSDTATATAGYFRLTWAAPGRGTPVFELQQARTSGFRNPSLLYRGTDEARMVSGRYDGDYFYRVRVKAAAGDPGPWSRMVKVSVRHHPLSRAFAFFAVGAAVFLATLGLVVFGHRSHCREH